MWIATQDMFPEAVKAMEAKYLDVGTIYDAFAHSKEAIRVAVRILTGKSVDCPEAVCLAKGRVTTQENIATIENLWSRQ